MLRIDGISGTEIAEISAREVEHLLALKRLLRDSHGWPLCAQQLLQGSDILDDFAKLEDTMELCLVLGSLSSANKLRLPQRSLRTAPRSQDR